LRRAIPENNKKQYVNAVKFFSAIAATFANLFITNYVYNWKFYIWLAIRIFSQAFAYIWDIYIGFGLLRSTKPGRYGLRDNIAFPAWFYYFAYVENFIARFFFIIPIFKWS